MLNPDEDKKDYLQIKLTSDAFEDGIPTFYKENPNNFYEDISPIHKLLFRLEKNKPLSINITYKVLDDEKNIYDLIDLFKEWFPFSYDRDYFRKYFVRQDCISIGAFIKLDTKDYLIGCALGEIISDDKFKKILPNVLVENSWFSLTEPEPVDCAILQSLGVIDEYRRKGVGTRLMEMFIEEVKKKDAVCIYLSTLSYNNSAIKFFENNQWHFYEEKNQHYKINDKTFNAKFYYYILDFKKCNKVKNEKIQNENKNKYKGIKGKADDGLEEITEQKEKGCFASIFNFFTSKKD